MSSPNVPDPATTSRLLHEVNASGFPFQHTVVQAIHAQGAPWSVEATEFPVMYRDSLTHVDILAWWHHQILLVGECKRANPAFANWLFLRSPFTFRDREHHGMWFEKLYARDDHHVKPFVQVIDAAAQVRPWHIALEVKTDNRGDPKGQGRTLSAAIGQAQLGVHGMIMRLVQEERVLQMHPGVILLPVIFTTARLFTAADPLNFANLTDGTLAALHPEEVPWLWFESNLPPAVIAGVQRDARTDLSRLGHLLQHQHTRGMAIVGPEGVASFLGKATELFHGHIQYAV